MSSWEPPPVTSLYVHVPFCAQKCQYCAFYSEAAEGALVNRYVGALIAELELVAGELQPRTIFIGGGTPSLLNLRQWERILQALGRLDLLTAEEWTVECNPATVSLDKARLLRAAGVTRVSMGVQSLNDALLDRLGRPDQGLAPEFTSLSGSRVAGWAYTVRGQMRPSDGPGDPVKMAACEGVGPDEVTVWAGDGHGVCYFGELIALGMRERGCVGAIVDGGVRDIEDVRRMQEAGIDYVLVASALHDGKITPEDVKRL